MTAPRSGEEPVWTPEQKLRADATNADIVSRFVHLPSEDRIITLVHEYADARVAAALEEEREARDDLTLTCRGEYVHVFDALLNDGRCKCGKTVLEEERERQKGFMTNAEVASLAAEIGNLCVDISRQWAELDSAREGLSAEDRVGEKAENARIEDGHSRQLRAIFDRYRSGEALAASALPSTPPVNVAVLDAVIHQLTLGDASDGDARDIAWCADQLEVYRDSLRSKPALPDPKPSYPTLGVFEALREWRDHWVTSFSDPITLNGAQADELCTWLESRQKPALPEEADLAKRVQDEAVRVCLSRSQSLMEDGPVRKVGESNEAHKCAMAVGLSTSKLTGYRPDAAKLEAEIRAQREGSSSALPESPAPSPNTEQ